MHNASFDKRGAATATFFVASDLGIGMGTILAGYIATASSYQTLYFITLIPVALSATVYYKYKIHALTAGIVKEKAFDS